MDDDLFLATTEAQVAVGIGFHQVTRVQPAIAKQFVRCRRVVPVTGGGTTCPDPQASCGTAAEFNVIIIAVKKPTGQMVFNPGPDYFLEGDDVLITLGNRDQLRALEKALA